jgi:hypothetical protein
MRSSYLVLSLFATLAQSAGTSDYAVQHQFKLGGDGGWDYLTVDSSANRLFISRSDRVLVVATEDGTMMATIPDTQGPWDRARAGSGQRLHQQRPRRYCDRVRSGIAQTPGHH